MFRDVDSPDTLYLFTADHGHVYADVARHHSTSTSASRSWPTALPVSPTGNPIYPNGSPRDVFLHVRPERRAEALELLQRHLEDIALVMPMDAALEQGLFGPLPVSPELRRRLGDILDPALSRPLRLVARDGRHGEHFYGHHGGLSPEELITVLGVIDAL